MWGINRGGRLGYLLLTNHLNSNCFININCRYKHNIGRGCVGWVDGFGDTVAPKILIYAKTDKQKLFYYYIDTRLVLIPAIPTFDNKKYFKYGKI